MKFLFLQNIIRQYIHILFLFFVLIVAVVATTFYTKFKEKELKYFEKISKNIYFRKTVVSIIEDFNPRFETIEYKIKQGDSFVSILDFLKFSENEKKKIIKEASKYKKLKKLKTNQKIEFKIDKKKPTKILEINFFYTNTRNIYLVKNLSTNNYEYKETALN